MTHKYDAEMLDGLAEELEKQISCDVQRYKGVDYLMARQDSYRWAKTMLERCRLPDPPPDTDAVEAEARKLYEVGISRADWPTPFDALHPERQEDYRRRARYVLERYGPGETVLGIRELLVYLEKALTDNSNVSTPTSTLILVSQIVRNACYLLDHPRCGAKAVEEPAWDGVTERRYNKSGIVHENGMDIIYARYMPGELIPCANPSLTVLKPDRRKPVFTERRVGERRQVDRGGHCYRKASHPENFSRPPCYLNKNYRTGKDRRRPAPWKPYVVKEGGEISENSMDAG